MKKFYFPKGFNSCGSLVSFFTVLVVLAWGTSSVAMAQGSGWTRGKSGGLYVRLEQRLLSAAGYYDDRGKFVGDFRRERIDREPERFSFLPCSVPAYSPPASMQK